MKPDATALRGIGFAQDVGGAIKRNRIDIFCGGNDRANYVASHLDIRTLLGYCCYVRL